MTNNNSFYLSHTGVLFLTDFFSDELIFSADSRLWFACSNPVSAGKKIVATPVATMPLYCTALPRVDTRQ
jgi:hypothetical protein